MLLIPFPRRAPDGGPALSGLVEQHRDAVDVYGRHVGAAPISPAQRSEAAITVPGCDMVSTWVIRPDTLVLLSSVVVLMLITLLLGWLVDFSPIVELSG